MCRHRNLAMGNRRAVQRTRDPSGNLGKGPAQVLFHPSPCTSAATLYLSSVSALTLCPSEKQMSCSLVFSVLELNGNRGPRLKQQGNVMQEQQILAKAENFPNS